jgi:hypothetical protein
VVAHWQRLAATPQPAQVAGAEIEES